jgi:hypothetical protein
MISKLLFSLAFLGLLAGAAGFAVLSVWDVPVTPVKVEKTLDTASFLNKG